MEARQEVRKAPLALQDEDDPEEGRLGDRDRPRIEADDVPLPVRRDAVRVHEPHLRELTSSSSRDRGLRDATPAGKAFFGHALTSVTRARRDFIARDPRFGLGDAPCGGILGFRHTFDGRPPLVR